MIALAQGENAHTRARAPHDPTPPTRPGVLQVATPAPPKEQGALWLPPCFFLFAVSGPPGFSLLGARGGVLTRRLVVLKAFRAYKTALNLTGAGNRALGCVRVVHHGDGAPGATLTAPGRRNLLK